MPKNFSTALLILKYISSGDHELEALHQDHRYHAPFGPLDFSGAILLLDRDYFCDHINMSAARIEALAGFHKAVVAEVKKLDFHKS